MRKILFIIMLLLIVGVSFGNYPPIVHIQKIEPNDWDEINILLEEAKWKVMSEDEKNHWFDSMNAEGMGIIIRGADRNYDTIIDHIQYFCTTSK